MSLDIKPVRDAIVALLKTVSSVGAVNAFEPLATNLDALKRYYLAPGAKTLRGWYVRRQATQEVGEIYERGVEYSTWRIQGFVAVSGDGSSEAAAQDLVESMRQAFRADYNLGGVVESTSAPSQRGEIHLQLREFTTVMFCDVLCHSIRLELSTERFLPVEEP